MARTVTSEAATGDPIAHFLEEQRYHGKSQRTLDAYERVLRRFETFLADPDRVPGETTVPAEATRRECMAWIHELRGEYARSTIASYAAYVHRFYGYMVRVEEFDANPMALVREEMDERIEKNPTRRDLSVSDVRSFVSSIDHPLHRAVIVTLLKTGIRVGELCNLDLRDCSLESDLRADASVRPRAALDNRPNALYVAAGTELSDDRPAANKRQRSTIVPIDDELARELTCWLAIRPDSRSELAPLFRSTDGDWGARLEPHAVRRIVRNYAEAEGWYEAGAGAGENVTPHYFRHFFTTHLRDRTGDRGIVKYLRGDVAEDIIDTYTHNWGGRVRDVYESNMYSLTAGPE
ncbi:tyrosine-type recombinase/integrase [Salinarchaeum laminariae]|uniref:tyrosine-type recombinase/integrase n=1 Tax=Salinarchaeum laminariae TaxID=869888 RepID=UPI0020C12AAA|nr:tyrosine-type recombinase/integrase [Salinarchaeum laminariae]